MPELSPEEERRQADILWPIRLRHHQELGRSGIAERVMNSPTRMNSQKPRLPLGETTLLYPLRIPLGGLIPGTSVVALSDAIERMIERTEPEAGKLMNQYALLTPVEQSYGYALALGRFDATPKSSHPLSRITYFAGVQFTQSLGIAETRGFRGVEPTDMTNLFLMLGEVAAAKAEYDLTCLNNSLVNTSIEDTSRGLPLP
jgi:hypothetical protein